MDFEIPKKFILGGVEHKVIIQKTVGDNCDFGNWDSVGTIRIAEMVGSEKTSISRQRQTFWHELTHSILSTMGKEDLNDDESFVNTFASFLSGAIDTMQN